ncbi:MAG TPA: hypothetical protein VGM31_07605 [Puia sp.]|jgi:hypothetical protein
MDAAKKYSIPKGYNTAKLILRSLRYSPTGQEPVMKPLITLRPDKVVLNLRRTGAATASSYAR